MKTDTKILQFLYQKKNDGKFYDVSEKIKHKLTKSKIDSYVLELEENGYVDKIVKGYLPESALTEDDDKKHTNSSLCKITSKGIEYVENFNKIRRSMCFSIVSLIIAILSFTFTFFTYLFN